MRDRRGERRPARGFEDQRETPSRLVDALDDLVGAAQMPAALGAADHGGDARPGARGDLGREMPDAAGSAGDQHPLAEQRRAVAQRPQRRQPGDRQGRGLLEARHCPAIAAMRWAGTAARCAQPALSVSATTRAPALGPLPLAAARTTTPLMSWPGRQPSGRDLHQPQFAAVQRKRPHLDERLVRRRLRLGHLAHSTGAAPFGVLTRASIAFSGRCPHPLPLRLEHPLPQCGRGGPSPGLGG